MQEIHTDFLKKVILHKRQLEKELGILLSNKGQNLFVRGKPENEYLAIRVFEAVNLGFSVDRALFLKDENVLLHILSIKELTRSKNFEEIRGRIIGTGGKTLRTLTALTGCFISIYGNMVGIIGDCEQIDSAIMALTSLIQGSRQGRVYGKVERENKRKRIRGKMVFYDKDEEDADEESINV